MIKGGDDMSKRLLFITMILLSALLAGCTLTEKEVDAIAAFCAYSTDLKAARISKDKSTMEMALFLKQLWERACTRARVPDYINQNEMDEILNVAASWDRKRFGKSYKPIR